MDFDFDSDLEDDIIVTPASAIKKPGAVRCQTADTSPAISTPVREQINGDSSLTPLTTSREPIQCIVEQPQQLDLSRPQSNASIPSHHDFDEKHLEQFVYPVDMQVRDYQRNIIRKALLRNSICALPTGLGKTFVASVVMLNWFRWTKNAKIVFVAPTRPLVTQQVESFSQITGISIKETAILSQEVQNKQRRHEEWAKKRVFFATAQTIENDLRAKIVDPRSIVLLVSDEAHRATGNHSYVKVVEGIRTVNPSFRVLGLTATPSGYFQGVQDIIDVLGIAGIEVRSENSLDIRQYVHSRQLSKIKVSSSDDIKDLLSLLARATEYYFEVLRSVKITSAADVTEANEYMSRVETNKYMRSPAAQLNKGRMFQIRTVSTSMQSICYSTRSLKTHGIVPFYTRMHTSELEWIGSKGKNAQESVKSPEIKSLLKKCRLLIYGEDKGPTYPYSEEQRMIGFHGHPKLTELIQRIDTFMSQNGADSRVIVFAELRDSAAEIMWMLRNYNANVRPHLFVGQSTNVNKSVKGMKQKEQQEVLQRFKSGDFNVLVATSIGEEGLDIGQVDLIICFDQSRSPIRNIQRMGRTGRKRQGSVIMLMTEQEEKKLEYAFEGHAYIRNRIMDSSGKNPKFNKNQSTYNANMDEADDSTHSSHVNNSILTLKYHPADAIFPESASPKYTEIKVAMPPENEEALARGDIIEAFKALKPKTPSKRRKKASKNDETPAENESSNFGFVSGTKYKESEEQRNNAGTSPGLD